MATDTVKKFHRFSEYEEARNELGKEYKRAQWLRGDGEVCPKCGELIWRLSWIGYYWTEEVIAMTCDKCQTITAPWHGGIKAAVSV